MQDPIKMIPMPSNARRFDANHLDQIAMPMGGIGAGCMCLNGIGGFSDFSIRHRPATTAVADGFTFTDAAFAVLRCKSPTVEITRLVEGPQPLARIYDQGMQAQGYRKGGHEGFPRFGNGLFTAAYPSGQVELSDPAVPLTATVTGWSPFVPLDDRTSGMPCAVLEYTLLNPTAVAIDYELSFHLSHLPRARGGWRNTRNRQIDNGILFYNTVAERDETFATATLTVVGHRPKIKAMWHRGGWFDWTAALWRELQTGTFRENAGNDDRPIDGHNGGSLLVGGALAAGASVTVPFVVTWHVPNVYVSVDRADQNGWSEHDTGATPPEAGPAWRPYYAGQWRDAEAVATELHRNFISIRDKTVAFRDAVYESTFPAEAIDAIASNQAILKSPTVLRQENGNLWGWEGCFTDRGCCPGSCTHVWNYAQSIPHLFPQLERTLREQELERSMAADGNVAFRAALPDGPARPQPHPAADGQLGGILKVFRDWQIGGDPAWLHRLYPLAKRSLDFCIGRWDSDRRGALFEPHHNTYDIEFWGPDGMCTSIYVGALSAMATMAAATGHADDCKAYGDLALKAARYCDEKLFNGEYYHQTVLWDGLRDRSFAESIADDSTEAVDPESLRVSRAEGPRHQYGDGCLSDGVIGAWMADLYGVDVSLERAHVRSTLQSIFRNNYRADLSAHVCTQRPGYATGAEPGLILCTWPQGNRPTLPFVYSDEVWTGIEYQVASHLISQGMVDEGMTIVRGTRSRYDGRVRNPFNEYECGSYYARAMASYALLQAISGFRYSAVTKTLRFDPQFSERPFASFFCTAAAYGRIRLNDHELMIDVMHGRLDVATLVLGPQATRHAVHRVIEQTRPATIAI